MKKRILIALAALSFLFVSCSKDVPYNSNSGDDGTRALAAAIALNQEVTDDLSAVTGDNEDWFYFNPTETGIVTVSVVVDDPAAITLTMSIYDSFGRELQTRESDSGNNRYEMEPFSATPDRFFVSMKTSQGEGKYTLKVGFEVPKDEPVEVNNEDGKSTSTQQARCVPANRCKPGQKCCSSKTETTTTTPAPTEPEEPPVEVKTIKGSIVLITPRGDDLSDIKINGIGLKKGVKPGMKATLRGLNRKVDIYKCLNTSCQATVKATSEELARYDTVDVVVE